MKTLKENKKLTKFVQKEKYDKAEKLCDKILSRNPENLKIRHIKAICHILEGNLSKFTQNEQNSEFLLEKAYCHYRLGENEKAAELLNLEQKEENERKRTFWHLLAQINYADENYGKSYEIYEKLKPKNLDESANTAAAAISFSNTLPIPPLQSNVEKIINREEANSQKETFEHHYNIALFKSQILSKYKNSNEAIEKAKEILSNALSTLSLSETEKNGEFSELNLLKGINYGALNEAGKAKNIFSAEENKDSPKAFLFKQNQLVIEKGGDKSPYGRFYQFKRKTKIPKSIEQKLNSFQLATIKSNSELIDFINNTKLFKCAEKTLEGNLGRFCDIEGLLSKNEQISNEQKFEFLLGLPCPLNYLPATASLAISFGESPKSKNTIIPHIQKSIDFWADSKDEGVIAKCMDAVCEKFPIFCENKNLAIAFLFENRLNYAQKLLEQAGDFCVTSLLFEKALSYYQKSSEFDTNKNFEITSKIIFCLTQSNIDPQKSLLQKTLQKLSFASQPSFDENELLSRQISDKTVIRATLKKQKQPDAPKTPPKSLKTARNGENPACPNLDPERWLPLRERSYFRQKKNKPKEPRPRRKAAKSRNKS